MKLDRNKTMGERVLAAIEPEITRAYYGGFNRGFYDGMKAIAEMVAKNPPAPKP